MPFTPWDDTINAYAGDLANDPEFLGVVASIIKAESGFRLNAVGDNGASAGPYQMHERGAGSGMSLQDRMNIDTASSVMVPQYARMFKEGRALGLTGPQLAVYVGGRVQRPAAGNERHYGSAYASIVGGDYDIGESIADSSNAGRMAGSDYKVPTALPRTGRQSAGITNTASDPLAWIRGLSGGTMAEAKRKDAGKKDAEALGGLAPLARLISLILGSSGTAALTGLGGRAASMLPKPGSALANPAMLAGLGGGAATLMSLLAPTGTGIGQPPVPTPDPGFPGPSTGVPGANHPGSGMVPSRTGPGPNHPGGLAPGAVGASPAAQQAQALARQVGGDVQVPGGAQQASEISQMKLADLIRRAYLNGGLDPAFLGNPLVQRSMAHSGNLLALSAMANLGIDPALQPTNIDRVNSLGGLLQDPQAASKLFGQLQSQMKSNPADSILAAKANLMHGAGTAGPVALSPTEQMAADEYASLGASSPLQFVAKQNPDLIQYIAQAMSSGNLGNQLFLAPYTENIMQQYAAFEPENILKRKSTLDLLLTAIQGMQGSSGARR